MTHYVVGIFAQGRALGPLCQVETDKDQPEEEQILDWIAENYDENATGKIPAGAYFHWQKLEE